MKLSALVPAGAPNGLPVAESVYLAPEARSRLFYEGVRANVKRPGNLAADSTDQLTAVVRNRLKHIQYRPALINGIPQTGLSLEPEPP